MLGREVFYYTIFPKNYEDSDCAFPVLYLLHGLFGRFDNWLTNTQIIEYAKDFPGLIVCIEGGDGWYSDNPHLKNHRYESYFFSELLPNVERRFKVGKNKNSRAIAGLSMGGYGAFKFAFRRPEMFCFAASMSGAFHASEISVDDDWTELQPSILEVFGNDEQIRAKNNLFQIAENFPSAQIAELPFFYFDCGAKDSFLPVNIALAEVLQQRGITCEFQELPGGHDWGYWDLHLKNILQMSCKFLK